jgi:serine/threonine protein kinase/WD40 repeat protein
MSENPNENNAKIDAIIAEYLAAEDSGQAPSPAMLFAAHPKHQSALQDFLMGHFELSDLAIKHHPVPVPNPYLFAPGKSFADYEILSVAGIGGSAVVYKARQTEPNREVALKVLTPDPHRQTEMVGRFRAEAAVLAKFSHPGIAPIYSFGEFEGFLYLTTEWFPGGSLQDKLEEFQTRPRTVAAVIRGLARSMAHAHSRGVIHRDLKPSNILFDVEGNAKLADFGFAFQEERPFPLTQTGEAAGTPEYMAPEQALRSHGSITVGTDVHGLGACMYACLTGKPPFSGSNLIEVLTAVVHEIPVSADRLNETVPSDLASVCTRCLEKKPAHRYRTVNELADDLDLFLEGKPTSARPTTQFRRISMWVKRRPAAAAALIGLFVMSLAIIGISIAAVRSELHAQASAEVASTQQFYTTLERMRTSRNDARVGWTARNLADVQMLLRRPVPQASLTDIRSEAAAALGSLDLIARPDVAIGFDGYAVAVHPKESKIAIGGWGRGVNKTIQVGIFDTQSGTVVNTLDFSSDEKWETRTQGRPDGVRAIAFSPDGRWLAASTRGGRVLLWEFGASQPLVMSKVCHRNAVEHLAFSQSSRILVSRSLTDLVSFDREKGWAESGHYGTGWVSELPGIIPDESFLIVLDDDFVARFDTQTLVRVDPWGTSRRWKGIFTPKGRGVIGLKVNRIELREVDTGSLAQRTELFDAEQSGSINRMYITGDEYGLIIASEFTNRIGLWDLSSLTPAILPARTGGGSNLVGVSPNDSRFYISGPTRTHVFDLSGRDVQSITGWDPYPLAHFDISESGNRLATTRSALEPSPINIAELFDRDSHGNNRRIFHSGHVANQARVSLTQDGFYFLESADMMAYALVAGNSEPSTLKWKVPNFIRYAADDNNLWVETDTDILHYSAPNTVPDGRWDLLSKQFPEKLIPQCLNAQTSKLLFGGRDGSVFRLSVAEKAFESRRLFDSPVTAVSLGDSTDAIAGNQIGDLCLFSFDSNRETKILNEAHGDSVTTISTSTSGLVASGSADRTVKLWNPYGEPVLTLRFRSSIKRVKFANGGKDLYILVSGERAVRVWHLDVLSERLSQLGLEPGFHVKK